MNTPNCTRHQKICKIVHTELNLSCKIADLEKDLAFNKGIASDSGRSILLAELGNESNYSESDREKIELNIIGTGTKEQCLEDTKDFEKLGDLPRGITKGLGLRGIYRQRTPKITYKLIQVGESNEYLSLAIF